MTDLDLSKYDGHTSGPWGVASTVVGALRVDGDPRDGWVPVADMRQGGNEGAANARLIADAPLLLAEVRRLDLEHKAAERELLWVRQSHARLLAAIEADADIVEPDETLCWCSKPPEVDHYGHCAELRAAVAEAEALHGE